MDVFSFITLIGGLALFLYGMHVLSDGLAKIAGGKLERMLKKMTSNPAKSLLLGAGVTAVIQSSSALTVMLVGLVNSGIMDLSRTVGVVMGSNIGTTFTAWILSLAGIESDNFFVQLLKPSSFSPVLAFIGIILIMVAKKQRNKDIGTIMVGFAVLMFGMQTMSDAVSPLADSPEFTGILTIFTNPLLGVLIGALFTAVIQSSSASVGVLQALTMTGSISYAVAIPIIMGQNIGTCVTALLSSIGVTKNAKRVAIVHVTFNILGTAIFLTIYLILDALFKFAISDVAASPIGIAICHSTFNVLTTLFLFPFQKQLEKIARFVVRDINVHEETSFLDERLLQTPSFAIAESENMAVKMAYITKNAISTAISVLENFNEKKIAEVVEQEQTLDMYEDKLGTYLVKVSSKALSDRDSIEVSKLLHSIGDFERIGDHALDLTEVAREMHDKELSFSRKAMADVHVLIQAIEEIVTITVKAFEETDLQLATSVEPLEQVIDSLIKQIKLGHVERLQAGACTLQLGFVFSNLLNNFERVSDHCSNIAVGIIELERTSFDTHEYLSHVKDGSDAKFTELFNSYAEKYTLASEKAKK